MKHDSPLLAESDESDQPTTGALSRHANCLGSRVRSERPGALVKGDPVSWTGEYHTTDGGAKAGQEFAWETYHDALPGCIGSGLHQVPRI
jgi:hypothetical protein